MKSPLPKGKYVDDSGSRSFNRSRKRSEGGTLSRSEVEMKVVCRTEVVKE